ncbi:helix-turn-helix domain-containing protein [Seongchinamella sediminis]|uniref:Helix-turn-helix domain-containing protein n=1 Tax=Seongchinamella sediminis TaxID=2283635 RepID=A0A3L7DV52_9GAMM|nr:helix-turn-helix domain-containing protein [Seongchinamella sediminis]
MRESFFVQIGRGEHLVDVQIATVGDIGLVRLGIDVESAGVNVLNPDYIGFVIPLSWAGDLFLNGERVNKSAIYMPGDLDCLHLHSKSRVILGVTMPRAPFVDTLAALRGVDVDDIRLLDREMYLGEAAVGAVASRLTAITQSVCNAPLEYNQHSILNEVYALLTDAYLHSPTRPVSRVDRSHCPNHIVRLAEERFMAAEGKPVSLADLCAAADVGKTSLYKAFNSVCGLPPLAYFQKRRLTRARSCLLHADNDRGGIKQTALSYGFTELGRFSAQYRQLFGELPSVTLSRHEQGY